MTSIEDAFKLPIKEGEARILLRFDKIECEVENNAPDFITIEKDDVTLSIDFPESTNVVIGELNEDFEVELHSHSGDESRAVFRPAFEGVWFDIQIDQVKDIWVADLEFILESGNPRYLAYYIKTLDHKFEWLQPDMSTGDIKTMSVSQKKYKTPKISGKETYTATDVMRCADMLNRAIKKIDLRVGGTYARFNTDKGRLEPLIIGIADKLGYKVERLQKEDIEAMEARDERVSHSVFLKRSD
jgi:hypothetical protein